MATAKYGQNDTMVQKAVRGLSQNKVWIIKSRLAEKLFFAKNPKF